MKRFGVLLAFALLALLAAPPAQAHTNQPWRAAVRVKVTIPDGLSIGSGTVVLSQSDRSYVLTCAHVFGELRDPKGFAGKIVIDLFDGELGGPSKQQVKYLESHEGQCVDFDRARDVGLIVFSPGRTLEETRPSELCPSPGEKLVAVGCGGGRDAVAWTTEALYGTQSPDGYAGIWCRYAPEQGRSGGGLHRLDGSIVGVCDFSNSGGYGVYAAPTSIKKMLDRNGLGWIYTPVSRGTAPAPTPSPNAPPDSPNALNRFNTSDPLHLLAAGLCLLLVASALKHFRLPLPFPFGSCGSQVDFRQVILRLKAEEELKAKLAEADALLEKFRAVVSPKADAPSAPPAPAPGVVAEPPK